MNGKLKKLFQQKVDGKTIIVTGASSGIGLTVSKYLAQAGAHVLLLARTKEKLDEVKATSFNSLNNSLVKFRYVAILIYPYCSFYGLNAALVVV